MNNLLFALLTVLCCSTVASGQIEIYVDGGTINYAGGGVLSVNTADGNELIHDIHFENHTGVEQEWYASRTRINRPSTWIDFLCWGLEGDPFGQCYDDSIMNVDPWISPASLVVSNGGVAVISSHITPSISSPAVVSYRYYVGTAANPYEDSMDIEVSLILNVPESNLFLLRLGPNPVADYLNISTSGLNNSSFKMTDVLGNLVFEETIIGQNKTINVENFKNGVYFLTFLFDGDQPITRRVIIKH